MNTITFAASKGRIFGEPLLLLEASGTVPREDSRRSHQRFTAINHRNVRVTLVRSAVAR